MKTSSNIHYCSNTETSCVIWLINAFNVFWIIQQNHQFLLYYTAIKNFWTFQFFQFFTNCSNLTTLAAKELILTKLTSKFEKKHATRFTLKIKKNPTSFHKLFLAYKINFFKNKPLFFKKYKFNKFFFINKLSKMKIHAIMVEKLNKNRNSLLNFQIINVIQSKYFLNKLTTLNNDWFFLIGNLISPFYWNLQNFKLKNLQTLTVLKKNSKNKKTLINSLHTNLKTFYKKTIINDFLYFKKSNFNPETSLKLLYFLKFQNNKKLNKIYNKPYLFFYNNEIFKSPNTVDKTMHNTFRNYSKLFILIKKTKIRGKNALYLKFHKLFIAKKNNNFYVNKNNNFVLFKNFNNFFVKSSNKRAPLFANFTIKKIKKTTLNSWKIKHKHNAVFIKKIKNYIKLNNFFLNNNLKRSRIKIRKNRLFCKIISNFTANSIYKLKIYKFKAFKLKKMLLWNYLSQFITNFKNKLNTINLQLNKNKNIAGKSKKFKSLSVFNSPKKFSNHYCKISPQFRFFSFLFAKTFIFFYSPKNKKFFSYNTSNVSTQNSPFNQNLNIKTNLHIPVLQTKTKLPLLAQTNGFLLINDFTTPKAHKKENLFLLKKSIYSFAYKNDMQKYILKRYLKNKFTLVTEYSTSMSELNGLINQNFENKNKNRNSFAFSKIVNQPLTDNNFSFKNLNSTASLLTTHLFSTKWLYWETQPAYLKTLFDIDYNFSIKRIKFKPGYMILWRNARKTLQTSLNLKFKYQKRLTRYLFKYNKFIKFKTFLILELRLDNVLLKTKLLPDLTLTNMFINNGLIFINGLICKNKLFSIFINDFIQLVINVKYYILYKWFLNWSLQKKTRLKVKSKQKLTTQFLADDKQRSNILPKWILNNKHLINDTAKYLEIDYFTLSIIVLYEPFLWNELNAYDFLNVKFGAINLYNWKYIT